MMRFFKRFVPILLSFFIVCGVIFSSYDTAKATGMEEYLYVTYWDLMNTLYSMCGYDMKVSDDQVKNHGVTGKQAWNNFTSFVDNAAKVHWKLYSDAGKAAVKELKDLANTAMEKGISISQDLYDMLKSVFANQVPLNSSGNFFDDSDFDAYAKVIAAICGTAVSAVPHYGQFGKNQGYRGNVGESQSYLLNIISYDNHYYIFEDSYNFESSFFKSGGFKVLGADWGRSSVYAMDYNLSTGTYIESVKLSPINDVGYSWLIRNGQIVSSDVISAQVSAGACPKEVPDVQPWIKSPAVPDEWRIIKPGENPKKDPDEKPDFIPGIIPFKPKTPEKPGGTEETEKSENPDKDKNKEKKPAYCPIINPKTGNVIDPETGLDIDPNTGKLIDPDTGKLIDPDDGGSGGGGGGGIADKLGKYGDITKLFPFCIPFDIVDLIKGMSAEKAPPVFHFKYYFKSINYTFKVDVDLSQYAKYIKLFRYGMQIFYILALMFMTIRISKLFI